MRHKKNLSRYGLHKCCDSSTKRSFGLGLGLRVNGGEGDEEFNSTYFDSFNGVLHLKETTLWRECIDTSVIFTPEKPKKCNSNSFIPHHTPHLSFH
jgi:hypothetical protein